MLPDEELIAVSSQIDIADELAAAGEFVAGYDLLTEKLHEALWQHRQGCPWGRDLVEQYALAVKGYVRRYGVKAD